MKKLKLKALELGAKELLTREQLKKMIGGDGSSGSCSSYDKGQCLNMVGSWSYTKPVTWAQCSSDIETYCNYGGECHCAGQPD